MDRVVAEWLDECNTSSFIADRIKNLEAQNALNDICRYVYSLEINSDDSLFLLKDYLKLIRSFYLT